MGLRTDVGITHQVRGLSYLVRVIVSHSLVYTHTHTLPFLWHWQLSVGPWSS